MAVTKTSVISVLVVLAITYNQGAARPMACTTAVGSSSSEESLWDCSLKIATVVKQGLRMKLIGIINKDTPNKALIVDLSKSGKESCRFKFDFSTKNISVESSSSNNTEPYDLDVPSKDPKKQDEIIPFSLVMTATKDEMFMMYIVTPTSGQSMPLFCEIDNFEDINQIDIIDGVTRVKRLLFQFDSRQ
ncbi:hypothetical protein PYW07_001771 [Mythimna separata]|uniref:Uncharacterized protein n=1 Tax=Mythimna separata TaxID=271217 RepID=A0AAD8DW67_MYTSE|nr:hypothetical protein PYW07_001771 [Mythimna separata]